MDEPKNLVTFTDYHPYRSYDQHVLYYKDFPDLGALPSKVLREQTIHEWADWWHWHVDDLKQKALEKWEDEDVRRHRVLDEWVDSGVE